CHGGVPPSVSLALPPAGRTWNPYRTGTATSLVRRVVGPGKAARSLAKLKQVALQIRRKRRVHVDPVAGERVLERQAGGVQELAAECRIGHAVHRVSDHRQADRGEMD